jgi:hypothetical protein
MTGKEFREGFLALKKDGADQDVNNYLRAVEIKTWDGQVLENDGRGSNKASTIINFAKMCDSIGPEYNAPGLDRGYTGSCANGMPVDVASYTDVADNDPNTRDKYVITLDPRAIASANYMERKAAAEEAGRPAPDKKSADRIPVKFTFPTTKNGVAGMSLEGLTNNVGKAATQRYILTASKNTAESEVPAREDIEAVAKLTMATFDKVLMECADGKAKKDIQTTGVNGPKQPIEGTAVDKPAFGVKAIEVDGATVYAIDTSKAKDTTTADVNKWLVDVNNRFNKVLSQEVNGTMAKGSMQSKLGNMIGIQAYAVEPQDPVSNEKSGLILIQPATTAQLQPYTSSLVKAYDAATHSKDFPGEEKNVSVDKIYDPKIVENAGKLAAEYNQPSGLDKDAAIKAVQMQLEGVQAQLGQ